MWLFSLLISRALVTGVCASNLLEYILLSHHTLESAKVLLLLWLAGLYLRLTILVAPALAQEIAANLALTQTGVGALTTIPVFMLALGALPGAKAIARFGPRLALAMALAVVGLASLARALSPNTELLFLASAVMGLAIAVMQPALPALVSRWLPSRIALGSAVYMNGMLMGEFIGAGLTLPLIMPLTGNDWRMTLVVWSLPAFIVAAGYLWSPVHDRDPVRIEPVWLPDWRDPLVWKLGFLLGAGASLFFGVNAYMGSILEARGEGTRLTAALAIFNASQVGASLLMLVMAKRWVGLKGPILVSVLASVFALIVFWGMPGWWSIGGAFVLGFGTGVLLILVVALPPQLLRSADAGRLAAGMFLIGYSLSFLLPLAGGFLADATGQPSLALAPLLAFGALTIGVAASLKPKARSA